MGYNEVVDQVRAEHSSQEEHRTHSSKGDGIAFVERGRRESERILDAIQQPLLVLDRELRVTFANRAVYRQFAVMRDDVVGLHLSLAGNRFLNTPALATFIALIQAGNPFVEGHEVEIVVPGLGTRVLLLTATKIIEETGATSEIVIAIDDVTERKHKEAEARSAKWRAERAKLRQSRFLVAAGHDLRQSLQALSLMRAVLAKSLKQGKFEEASRLVVQLNETADAMSGVLDTLLDINQLEAGILQPERVDFSINGLLEKLGVEFFQHTRARGLSWRMVPCGVDVHSDPHLLEQIIRNFLSNAVKYTKKGKVLLGCRRRGGKLRIEVWDSGVGIPQTQISMIFREFHRGDNSAGARGRGFGLGLAIVRRFCDLLGHVVYVHSLPGSGSVFAVEVPIAQGVSGEASPPPPGHAAQVSDRHATVLIVEAEPTVREMLGRLLANEGHHILLAEDGEQARTLALGAGQPDLVVAGYQFPKGMNGLEVILEVRELLGRRIPAVVLTGYISTDVIREISRQGCVQRTKPIKADDLLLLIQSLFVASDTRANRTASSSLIESGSGRQFPTISVVDDDSSIREAMREMFRDEAWSIETYPSAEAFLAAFRPQRENVLLVDAQMPGMNGVDLLEQLRADGHMPPAVMISGHADIKLAVRAMRAGAVAFLEKPVEYDELTGYIEQALQLSRSSAARATWHETAARRIATLTLREHQVMELVLEGKANKVIAHALGISQRTVETHRATVMRKTNSRSLSELVHVAIAGGGRQP